MSFNKFRIVVTLLACFGPFFAYICRLNLSLTIEEMVVKDIPELDNSSKGCFEIGKTRSTILLQTEEHTLAWMSSSCDKCNIFIKTNQSQIFTKKNPKNLKRLSHRLSDRSSISTLAIEFNVDSNHGASGTKSDIVNSTSGKLSQAGDSAVQVIASSEPHLLHWSQEERNDLLGAFFIGYLLCQIPGARAAEMFGAKSMFIVAGIGSGLCSLLFPMASKYSSSIIYAYIVRMLMGASQGAMFPTAYVFICEWLPKSERSQWLAVPTSFSRIGTTVMNAMVPIIMLNYGWEMVFYISGLAALLWSVVFTVFGSNAPSQSYWLSKDELVYIESHMEPRVGTLTPQPDITASGFELNEAKSDAPQSHPPVSWLKMATNKAMLILSLAMFVSEWSNMLLLIKLPGFLGPVLGMDLADIGFWSSCLIIVYSIHCPLSGILASKIERLEIEWLNTLRVRKLFEILAHVLQGTACLVIGFSSDKVIILIALFTMMIGRATVGGGQLLMPPELSKEYPGTVFAFANTLANTAGVIGPMTINWLVADCHKHASWFNLWLLSAALFFASGIVFTCFADNKPQNYGKKPKSKGPRKAISEAQLTLDKDPNQIISMDAFSRIASEPNPVVNGTGKKRFS